MQLISVCRDINTRDLPKQGLNTHRAITYLCTAHKYEEMRGSFYCFKGVTKEHMVCCSNTKMTPGIYVFSSKIHSVMPKSRNTSCLLRCLGQNCYKKKDM